MPKDIVKHHGSIFEKEFIAYAMRVLPDRPIKTRAFDDEGKGFPGSYIFVAFSPDTPPESLYGMNMVRRRANCVIDDGYIELNPVLLHQHPKVLKTVLAEEWLEVMMSFRVPAKPVQKSIRNKISLALMFNTLKKRGFWQDSLQEHEAIYSALRSLLAPRDKIEIEIKELHGLTLDELRREIAEKPAAAQQKVEFLVQRFSIKYSVDKDLVWDRLIAILSDGRSDT